MNSIDHKIAEILGCDIKNIRNVLNYPGERERVVRVLDKCKLVTLYKNQSVPCVVVFGGISLKSARNQYAYQKFMLTTVHQHFYARHRILLDYPDNPCVMVTGSNFHIDYYPLELVGIKPKTLVKQFSKCVIGKQEPNTISPEMVALIREFIRKGEQEFNDLPTPTSSAMGGGEDIILSPTTSSQTNCGDSSANETWSDSSDNEFEDFYDDDNEIY